MGRIQSNVGLITGIPIGKTVDSLMQLAARPRELLVQRTDGLKAEQVAVTSLSALLLSVQFVSDNLGKADLYDERKVTSSNPSLLSATATGNPPKGSYQFTPLRAVQNHQLISSGFKSDTDSLGGGTLSFRFGANVERRASLAALGGGQGVTLGKIRITDRSGASAEVDLSTVRTMDDVLAAINGTVGIDVTASVAGDRLRLVDNTGQTVSNLKVAEVAGGTTAASLGLDGIDAAAGTADGRDMLRLDRNLDLDFLNDGRGVASDPVFADIRYTLRDGTQGEIDLSPIIPGGSTVDKETTLGEVLDRINAAAPGKLQVDIAADGDRLVMTDLTTGTGTFQLESLYDSEALRHLGLDGAATGGGITGRRILGGMQSVLLASLGAGQGLGQLGSLDLTDRSGAGGTVDLAAAETLEDVLDAINAAAVGISARLNAARTGIELVDTTGATAGNLVVASGDATGTAENLGIAVNAAVTSVASGDMHLQVVARNTRLDDLNGKRGIARGSFRVTDSGGRQDSVDLSGSDVQTVGDVIRAINRLNVDVVAELNETGDGIRVRDLAGGPGTMGISEEGFTTAADLHLLGDAVQVDINGQMTQVIDGAATTTIQLAATDSLNDLRDKINQLGAGLTASTFYDGSASPYRLSLASQRSGKAGRLVLDTSGLDLSLQETVAPQDALLLVGALGASGPNVLVSSSSNTFDNVLAGASLHVNQASSSPVTITVDSSDTNLVASVKTLVDNYNQFRDKLAKLTKYDPASDTRSVLTGDATALRLDTDLSRLLSGRFPGAGSIRSLAELGITLKQDGTLSLDEAKLRARFQSDPDAVREFFTHETTGFSARLGALIKGLSGDNVSLLSQRITTLGDKIEANQQRIQFMNDRLTARRDRLLLQFYRLETVIGKMQTNLTTINSIAPLAPLTTASKS